MKSPDACTLGAPIGAGKSGLVSGLPDCFIVVENSDPPEKIRPLAHIEAFTGRAGVGRYGLFPAG
jgi:hypothetical protein